MARPKKLLTESDIQRLQTITMGDNTAAVGYRLAAVRTYVNHSAAEVASFFGITTETVIRWVSKYHEHGVAGLCNQSRGHRIMKLTGENADAVRHWLNNECNSKGEYVHFCRDDFSINSRHRCQGVAYGRAFYFMVGAGSNESGECRFT